MTMHESEFARLSLLIRRIQDADALCEPESEALITETEAARRSLQEGDAGDALRRIAQVACFTEALVHTLTLDPADGRAILETIRLLTENAH